MKKAFTFDWRIFKNRGFDFQDMCADIFKSYGYRVRVLAKGGSDEGRDIEIYTHTTKSLVAESQKPWAWVECKSRIAGNGLKLNDIKSNIWYAFNDNVRYLIFMTNHQFGNEAHHLFSKYSANPQSPISIRRIEKDELEEILIATPQIYCKYFDPDSDPSEYVTIEEHLKLDSTITPNSKFRDEFEGYRVNFKNKSFNVTKLQVTYNSSEAANVQLAPLQEKTVFIKAAADDEYNPAKIIVNSEEGRINVHTDSSLTIDYKIDHIFVDPFNLRQKVIDNLEVYDSIYLTAGPGLGKSRLLKEIRKSLKIESIAIDISSDYNKSFFDHLLDKLLGIEKEYLAMLPGKIISEHLALKNITDTHAAVLIPYLKGASEVNYDILITIISELYSKTYLNSAIFIDNIHNFSLLDFKLFKSLLNLGTGNKFLFSARHEEITEGNLSLYLSDLQDQPSFLKLDLHEINLKKIITEFIQVSSADETTQSFLRKYQSVETFQKFILILKNLKTKGLLKQFGHGKIILHQIDFSESKTFGYQDIYYDTIAALKSKLKSDEIEKIIKLASVFGYCFPLDLVNTTAEITSLLDQLIMHEILVTEETNPYFLKFDHELTRDILYKSMPPLEKLSHRKTVISYLESVDETSPVYSPKQLYLHYQAIGNLSRAAIFANKEGYRLFRKSDYIDSYSYFQKTLEMLKDMERKGEEPNLSLEADSLANMIDLEFTLNQTDNLYDKIRSLHVLTHLVVSNFYEGRVYYYFAKYYLSCKKEIEKSLEYIERALLYFKNKNEIENAKTINLKGLILKRAGRYDEAEIAHKEAINILIPTNSWDNLSEAYADLGAVYLESDRGYLAIDLWRDSLATARQTGNLGCICDRLIDYSYLLALYRKNDVTVPDEMANALFMSRRLRITPNVCRTLINYSNYLYSVSGDTALIKLYIDEAINIANVSNYHYLLLLSLFSYHVFKCSGLPYFDKDYEDKIKNMLVKQYCRNDQKQKRINDVRIMNIFKYFIVQDDDLIVSAIRKSDNEKVIEFVQAIKNKSIEEIEKNNPFLFDRAFLTYY